MMKNIMMKKNLSQRDFWSGFFCASLAFWLVLSISFFSTFPILAQETEVPPPAPEEAVIVTGDAQSDLTVENTANTSEMTTGDSGTPPVETSTAEENSTPSPDIAV